MWLLAAFVLFSRPVGAAGPPPGSARAPSWIEAVQTLDAESRGTIARFLEENVRPVRLESERASSEIGRQADSLETAASALGRTLNQRRSCLAQAAQQRRQAGHVASLLSMDTPWFWLSGLLPVATLAGVIAHDGRHSLRRRLARRTRGRFMLALVLASAALGAILGYAALERGDSSPLSVQGALEGSASPTAASKAALLQSGDQSPQSRIQAAEALGPAGPLSARSQEFHRRMIEVGSRLAALRSAAEAVDADLAALENVNRELVAEEEATAGSLRLRDGIRAGLGLGLLASVAAGGWRFRQAVARRRQLVLNTCPLCLGPISSPGDSPNGRPPPEIIRCRNLLSREPPVACNYAFRAGYRGVTKLSLPILGVPKAGKTHWLAMLHWQLGKGICPRSVRFQTVKRLQAESSEDYDRIIEQVLYSRLGTTATQRDRIPYPVVLQFQDRDRWGRCRVLLNLFDYSGEVTSAMGADDYRRNRALQGDGFLFFLDPTFPGEPQAKALAEFHEDLALLRGTAGGGDLGVPVAVCVSKIDLLGGPRGAGCQPTPPKIEAGWQPTPPKIEAGWQPAPHENGDFVAGFYDRLREIDPSGESLAREVLQARSEMVVRLRDAIWPGWEVERALDDWFPGRWLFFPLTPVGLDGRGETDLNLRTIAPFGLLEPLAWLLDKCGYPVLQ